MAQLGDKWYNKVFYGERQREWYNTGETMPHATLVDKNTWGYYSSEGEFIPGRKGQPLDKTIALWLLDKNCSWATNSTLYIKSQSTLLTNIYSTINYENVPYVMQATAHDSNLFDDEIDFSRNPVQRLAYDNSVSNTTIHSALYADINYSAYCLQAGILAYDWSLPSDKLQGRTLSNLISFIDTDPDKRDVVGLRGYLYRGTGNERIGYNSNYNGADYMPAYNPGAVAYRSIPLGDIFADYVIPEDATYLRSLIQDGHSDWIDDKVYAPFFYQYGRWWFETTGSFTEFNNQFTVGCFRDLPVSSMINGHYAIDSPTHKITGQFCKYNPSLQIFDDVSYRWKLKVVDQTTGDIYENGYDLTQLPSNRYLRVISYIYIEDMKDAQTKGEALKRAVLHEFAYLGFYFTSTDTYAKTLKTGTGAPAADLAKLYLPVFEAGATTGRYVTGEDIRDAPNADSTSVGGEEFRPTGEYSDSTPNLSNIAIGSFYKTGRLYTGLDSIEKLFNNIKAIPSSVDDQGEKVKSQDYWFFGADPYDYIIGYYMYPVMLLPDYLLVKGRITSLTDKSWIQLGKWDTSMAISGGDTKGVPFDMVMPMRRIFVQPTFIPSFYKNFLDFEPYTTMSLYLPYYGSLQLPPSLFIGHYIMILVLSDLMAGRCTYLIYCDDKQYISVSANCRVELPITGEDISAYCENIIRGKQEVANTIVNTARNIANIAGDTAMSYSISKKKLNPLGQKASIARGIISGAGELISGGMNTAFQISNMKRLQPTPQTISLGSGTESLGNILEPFIVLNLPEKLDSFNNPIAEANYGKINGFACYDVNTLSAYHGFTIMENPILDGLDCSAEEKEMIRNLLSEGVILP